MQQWRLIAVSHGEFTMSPLSFGISNHILDSETQLMCPSHPEDFTNWVMISLRQFTSILDLLFCSYHLDDGSIFSHGPSEIHSVLIHGSFIEISLQYFVFISSVEICIYMFNKTRNDLLLPLASCVTADSVSSHLFWFLL